jgi:predicted ATP-binding protein involved in virulence
MKIDSITLQNYRCHADLRVSFEPGFNVVVGVNGSGKTSLLKGVCEALNGLLYGLNAHHMQPLGEAGHVRLLAVSSQGRFRYEPQYPVKICAAGEAFETGCVWTWTKSSQVSNAEISGQFPGQVWQNIQRETGPGADALRAATALPLVSFYRANRHWNQAQPHELQSATQRNSRIDGYASWWDASLDSVALQGWTIGKCLERFQISSETGVAFDAIDSDELALVNAALAAAVEGVKGLRYDLKQKSLLVEWLDVDGEVRDPTAFENLSDGQRAVIGLVADIARRMCLLNPQLGIEVTGKTPGVVLIDELDMHLHPKWQRIVTRGLKAAFPALQFIVASHSPQVLGELKPEEIILLNPHGTSHPQVSYGLDSSRVLEEIMGATERSVDVEKALTELFATLERNELDSARTQLKALTDLAPGIAELGGAQALLKRKEVLGR